MFALILAFVVTSPCWIISNWSYVLASQCLAVRIDLWCCPTGRLVSAPRLRLLSREDVPSPLWDCWGSSWSLHMKKKWFWRFWPYMEVVWTLKIPPIQGDVTFEANWGQYYARSTTTGGYVSVGNQKLADLVRLSLHLQFLHAGIIP